MAAAAELLAEFRQIQFTDIPALESQRAPLEPVRAACSIGVQPPALQAQCAELARLDRELRAKQQRASDIEDLLPPSVEQELNDRAEQERRKLQTPREILLERQAFLQTRKQQLERIINTPVTNPLSGELARQARAREELPSVLRDLAQVDASLGGVDALLRLQAQLLAEQARLQVIVATPVNPFDLVGQARVREAQEALAINRQELVTTQANLDAVRRPSTPPAPPTGGDDDDEAQDSTNPLLQDAGGIPAWAWILIGLAVVGLIAGLIAWAVTASNKKKKKENNEKKKDETTSRLLAMDEENQLVF
jgi:hypothetical protein